MKKVTTILLLLITTGPSWGQGYKGLVAHWKFSGNANDSSGNGLNGVATGTSSTAGYSGLANTALLFNGSGDHIDVPYNSLMNVDSFSVCTLIKQIKYYSGACQANFILMRGYDNGSDSGAYCFQFNDETYDHDNCSTFEPDKEQFVCQSFAGSWRSSRYPLTTTVDTGKWYCVVSTYDRDSMRIYIEGILVAVTSWKNIYSPTNDPIGIGYHRLGAPSNYYWFNGIIDDIRLYSRALTSSEASTYCDSVKMPPAITINDSLNIIAIDTNCNTFKFTATTKDTTATSYNWAFGDGTNGSGNPVTHTYKSIGSYTVIVTATNAMGKIYIASHTITINSGIINVHGDSIICLGNHAQLNAPNAINYIWTPSESLNNDTIPNPIATPHITTTYTVVATDANGCIGTDSMQVTVLPLPQIDIALNNNYRNCKYHGIQLKASGAKNYLWTPSNLCNDPQSDQPVVILNTDTRVFTVKGIDSNGCISHDTITVRKFEEPTALLPAAFSPNGDGANDILYVRGNNFSAFFLEIFNRYGQSIFQTNDINRGWDGTFKGIPQPVEDYAYLLKIITTDGCPVAKTGNIILLR